MNRFTGLRGNMLSLGALATWQISLHSALDQLRISLIHHRFGFSSDQPRSRGALSELRCSRRGHCDFRYVVGSTTSTSRNASLSPIIHCINVMQCISFHTQLLVQVSGTGTANGMHSYLLPIRYYPSLASRTKLSCADSRRKVKGSFD